MGDFKINRLQHYLWFFDFLWWCIKDMVHPIDCIRYGLIQENWQDFKTRMYFDANPEGMATIKRLEETLRKHAENN